MNRPVTTSAPPSPSAPSRQVPVPTTPSRVADAPMKNPSVMAGLTGKSPLPPRKSLIALRASVTTLC